MVNELTDWVTGCALASAVLCCAALAVCMCNDGGRVYAQRSMHVSLHYIQLNLHCANHGVHACANATTLARPRSITINFIWFFVFIYLFFYFLHPTTHTLIWCVSFALFMLLFHRPSSSSPALLHFAWQIVLKSCAAHAGRHTGWRHSSRHATISMCAMCVTMWHTVSADILYFFFSFVSILLYWIVWSAVQLPDDRPVMISHIRSTNVSFYTVDTNIIRERIIHSNSTAFSNLLPSGLFLVAHQDN